MSDPVVLVAGMLCDDEVFRPWLATATSGRSVRLVRPSAESVDAVVAAILTVFPGRFRLVGFSLGGIVAIACALAAPERISRLGLVAVNPLPPRKAQREQWRGWRARSRAGVFAEVVDEVVDAMVPPGSDPDVRRRARKMAMRVGPAEFDRQLALQQSRPEERWALERIAAPTLILAGADDPLCPPPFSAQLHARIPRSRRHVLSDCGHLPFWERPHATASLLAGLLDPDGDDVVYSSEVRPGRRT